MDKEVNVRSSLIKMIWHRIMEDDLPGLSSQLAYNFLFSLFPLLIVIFTLLPYLPIPQEDILGVIAKFAPKEAMTLIEKTVGEVMNERNGGLLSFGIIGTVFAASNGINAIVVAFNRAYKVKESRSFIVSRLMSILLTLGMVLVFILAIILPIFGRQIGQLLFTELGYSAEFSKFWNALSWLVSAVILFLLFTGLYWAAPNVKLRCRSALPGAAFATFGWIISSLGLSFYVANFGNFSLTYGSIGAIIVLMTWLYITAFVIILGGEINAFYTAKKRTNC